MLENKGLDPVPLEEESDFARALKFGIENGSVDLRRVALTKQRLGEWWKKIKGETVEQRNIGGINNVGQIVPYVPASRKASPLKCENCL